ncbi:MAG: hypothetical protein II752_09175 [Muribaculaceae bacterium]|nr:hypothetical protein [Muribaculaceae bacterium]
MGWDKLLKLSLGEGQRPNKRVVFKNHKAQFLIGWSADGFATAGCLSGNTRFGISPSHFVGSSFLTPHS